MLSSVTSIGSTLSGLSVEELGAGSGSGPLPIVLSLLTSSSLALDLTAHQDALHLTGNLFAGWYHSIISLLARCFVSAKDTAFVARYN